MYNELQQAKAKIQALKEAQLSLPTPTQHSQPMSRGASSSMSMPRTTELPSSTSRDMPPPMETDQGYDPTYDDPPPPICHLLARRPGDDRMIEDHRRRLNEKQADFERRCAGVLQRLWPGMEQTPDKMWPPIYVMRLEAEKQFEQWHKDNPCG